MTAPASNGSSITGYKLFYGRDKNACTTAVEPPVEGTETVYDHDVSKMDRGKIWYCVKATNARGDSSLSALLELNVGIASDVKVQNPPTFDG